MSLSWKPKRAGKIYCAPACGRGCTHAEYLKAHKRADALIKKCEKAVGGKWIKRVHENLGWHYSVILKNGDVCINEYSDTAKPFSIAAYSGGTPSVVFVKQFSNSIKWLVDEQIKVVQDEADRWNNYLISNKKLLGRK